MGMWEPYVPVHERRLQAQKKMEKLKKKGKTIEAVNIEGRTIAKRFWGKKWCDHIEGFADYDNRLPRGRTYVRNGSVCHLGITEGQISAMVNGSSIYNVTIKIKTLSKDKWASIKSKCNGMVGSILELLNGKISNNVMEIVADTKEGLFPSQKEISYDCSCPDWADMCKHVAAVLYGIGNRLDDQPNLLFHLRGVDPQEMVSMSIDLESSSPQDVLQSDGLAELFGIDLDVNILTEEKNKPAPKQEAVKKTKQKKQKSLFDPSAITAQAIKTIRQKTGLSVIQFADKLGITPPTVYRWEKCVGLVKLHDHSKEVLISLAKKL